MTIQPTEVKALRFYFVVWDFNKFTFFYIFPAYLFLLHDEASIHLLPDEKIKLQIFPYKK